MLADSVSTERKSPVLEMAPLSLCLSHGLSESPWTRKERKRESYVSLLFIKTLIMLGQGPTIRTSFKLNYFH